MFAAGDRVVYPLHGGAIITSIEQRTENGEAKDYFVLKMLFDNMVISVPVCSAEKVGLRFIVDDNELVKVADVLHGTPDLKAVKSISWNRRFHIYMDKIKSGSILEVAEVFKTLSLLEKDKKISVGERRLLHSTKQILQSEIMLIKNINAQQADLWLKKCC